MQELEPKRFIGTRCNIRTWTGTTMVPCWIVGMKEGSVILRTTAPKSDVSPCKVVLEAYGRMHHANVAGEITITELDFTLTATVDSLIVEGYVLVNEDSVETEQHHFIVELTSLYRLEPIRSRCRVLTCAMDVYLNLDGEIVKCAAVDVSETGIGMTGPVKLEQGRFVRILVIAPKVQIEMKGEVMYCLPVMGKTVSYRVGLLLVQKGQGMMQRWADVVKNTQGDDVICLKEAS